MRQRVTSRVATVFLALGLACASAAAHGSESLPSLADMDVAWETPGAAAVQQALPAPATSAAGKVFFSLRSPSAGQEVPPGARVDWTVSLRVTGPNQGLALFSADLRQDTANPELFDLPPAAGAPAPMAAFDRPLGFTNPAADPWSSAYGGLSRRLDGSHRDLLQMGGAQNTFGVPGPCLGPAADLCQGQATEVVWLVGRRGGVLAATGSFVLPATPGLYTFYLDAARANVLTGLSAGAGVGVRAARVDLEEAWFQVRVAGPLAGAEGELAARPRPTAIPSPAADAVLRPAEGAALPYTHVPFRWPSRPGGEDGYRLQIAPDDGSADPFAGAGMELLEEVAPGPEPRLVITEGLEFGRDYAWRVGTLASAADGAPVHRFRTLPLPAMSFDLQASEPEPGPVQPGVTLFNVSRRQDPPEIAGPLALAVDRQGEPIYFTYQQGEGNAGYIEVRPETGRLLIMRSTGPGGGGDPGAASPVLVNDETLDGRIAWQAPAGRGYRYHHDADLMPDGQVVLLLYDDLLLPEDGGETRFGDRIVILDRHTQEEIWSWAAIDHYSTLDGNRFPDWTHGNAANYVEADHSIYFSARHLSRITRIDVATGQVVYNMGAIQPSGDTDFGDGFFTFQHSPEILPNGNMVLFDNGNESFPRVSRAVEIQFNSNQMPTSGQIVWDWVERNEDGFALFSGFAGDADRLPNGNTILSSAPRATLYEVTRDGRLVWKLRVGQGFPFTSIYRVQMLEALHADTPGDRDGDQDVDLLDLAGLQAGAGGGPELGFPDRLSDMDDDGDLDGADAADLARWMTGPLERDQGVPPP